MGVCSIYYRHRKGVKDTEQQGRGKKERSLGLPKTEKKIIAQDFFLYFLYFLFFLIAVMGEKGKKKNETEGYIYIYIFPPK